MSVREPHFLARNAPLPMATYSIEREMPLASTASEMV
jgi:hypothetical protein